MCVKFFNFIFCLTKPNSIPEHSSSVALKEDPAQCPASSLGPGQVGPSCPSPEVTAPLRGRGEEEWGRGLPHVFFQTKKHNLIFLYKSKKRKPKKIPTFELLKKKNHGWHPSLLAEGK